KMLVQETATKPNSAQNGIIAHRSHFPEPMPILPVVSLQGLRTKGLCAMASPRRITRTALERAVRAPPPVIAQERASVQGLTGGGCTLALSARLWAPIQSDAAIITYGRASHRSQRL